ncbi:MAG: metal-dependent transcriptional regulator [Methanospirillum sp.]|nr:metal-dependent transcriptional regulator [Methanospirillum sp.]
MRRKTIEEYIETIALLEEREGRAQTGAIASNMGVKPPSATEMLQKLEQAGLIHYESYDGAVLTGPGRRLADELTEKHRTITDLLDILGVEHGQADLDACQIEHHVSAGTVERLADFVEFVGSDEAAGEFVRRFRSRYR